MGPSISALATVLSATRSSASTRPFAFSSSRLTEWEFLAAVVGGTLGGIALGQLGPNGVFVCAAALTLLWLPLVIAGSRRIGRAAVAQVQPV